MAKLIFKTNNNNASELYLKVVSYCLERDYEPNQTLISSKDNEKTGAMERPLTFTKTHLPLIQHLYAYANAKSPRAVCYQL
jgi:hypothetical protein